MIIYPHDATSHIEDFSSVQKGFFLLLSLAYQLEVKLQYKNYTNLGFPCGSAGEEPACTAGDPISSPGPGRSAGEGVGYPFQYSGLENSMDCIFMGSLKFSIPAWS